MSPATHVPKGCAIGTHDTDPYAIVFDISCTLSSHTASIDFTDCMLHSRLFPCLCVSIRYSQGGVKHPKERNFNISSQITLKLDY